MAVLLATACAASCADSQVSFQVAFDDDAARERARVVELEALAGGCEGAEVAYRWTLNRETTPESAELPDGRYGIRARAVDATCTRFAEGCVDVELPLSDDVAVTVRSADALYRCGDLTCDDGTCDAEGPPGNIAAMGLGEGETCGVSSEGALWCWGSNEEGQLGLSAMPDVLVPTQVPSTERFVSVDLGYQNSCALTREGGLRCAGLNRGGAGGTGDGLPRREFTAVAGEIRFTSVSTGYGHTCGIAEDSTLYCWGLCCGQLGQGPRTDNILMPTPISTGWTQVSAGGYDFGGEGEMGGHACAIRADGSLWCWGDNSEGQLGVGDQEDRSAPTEVTEPSGPWAQVQAGGDFTCAIRYDATLWCWGYSLNGALGLGEVASRTVPRPRQHPTGAWRALGAAARSTCGVRQDGSLWCWGLNSTQQVGQPDMRDLPGALSPLQAHTEREWVAVFGGQRHLCALDLEGDAYCWGDNSNGELGRGSAGEASPVAEAVMLREE